MALATIESAELAYGHVPLLDRASFIIEQGERIALIGRNGAGKSSLLHVLSGARSLDDGIVWRQPNLRWALVEQEPVLDPAATVFDAVSHGLREGNALLAEYESLLARVGDDHQVIARLSELEARLSETGAWQARRQVEMILEKLVLAPDMLVGAASGGMRKRIALARALVGNPELLLLDEPTNHLDIESIAWLETLLLDFRGAVVFVTHDRAFLDHVATRVVELDRGRLLSFPGNYAAYQRRKAEQIEVEEVVNAKFDKFLKAEEVWIRKGVEARRTRNEGRVRRLESLRRERADRRARQGSVSLAVDDTVRSGKLVAELIEVSKSWGERHVVKDLSLTIMRGDKLGLVGPNGAGKTTLIRLLLGNLAPDSGHARLGTNLEVAYFDQLRAVLDDDATLLDTISPGSEWIETGARGAASRRHVMTYLGEFLFPPERAQAKVGALSGGERNRLLLARLFARPANLLVLDEPTNDLDIDTLELLETLLQEYSGTVVIVSHDRVFLDNVATQVLVSEGDGRWTENPGGYSEWLAYLARRQASEAAAQAPTPAPASPERLGQTPRRKQKLSFKESRELENLPARIAALEAEQAELNARLSGTDIYVSAPQEVAAARARAELIEADLISVLERWEELERKRA